MSVRNLRLLIAGVTLLTLLMPLRALASGFSRIYVFGDSLSDTGNVFSLTGTPPAPYQNGRFSNGDIWIDGIAETLEREPVPFTTIALVENPAATPAAATAGINFAFGGATTGSDDVVPGVLQQIDRFARLIPPGETADGDALYIVWAGANDYLGDRAIDSSQPIANLARAIERLTQLGARTILVANLPDLGQLPATRSTPRAETLAALSAAHNAELAQLVSDLDQRSPEVNLLVLDVNALFQQALMGDGFTNVTDACFDRATGAVCPTPDTYLFWDGIHPTTAAHQRLEAAALAILQPAPAARRVPVPAIGLGVLVLGLLGAGSLLPRRWNGRRQKIR